MREIVLVALSVPHPNKDLPTKTVQTIMKQADITKWFGGISMDRYIYPAIFEHDNEGYTITFPDLPGCITCGENLEQAYLMAKDALELHLFGMEQDNDEIPRPSEPEKVKIENDSFITLIEAFMPLIRDEMAIKAVKKRSLFRNGLMI